MKKQKPDLEKIAARNLHKGDLFKFLPDNKYNAVVTDRDSMNIFYLRDGTSGYVKHSTTVYRVHTRIKVSQLNPDGSETLLGECNLNDAEGMEMLLPKLPPLDEMLFAQALGGLRSVRDSNMEERAALDKSNNPRDDNAIAAAELVIEDCTRAIKTLAHIQRLHQLKEEGAVLTSREIACLEILKESLK